MTLRDKLYGEVPKNNTVFVYGADEDAEWVSQLQKDDRITISLSQNPTASLETLQFVEDEPDSTTTTVHVVNSSTAERNIVQATNDALNQPDDVMILLDRSEGGDVDLQHLFSHTGSKVVFEDNEAVDHILARIR